MHYYALYQFYFYGLTTILVIVSGFLSSKLIYDTNIKERKYVKF